MAPTNPIVSNPTLWPLVNVADLLGDDSGRIRGRHVADLADELLNLLWLKDQARQRPRGRGGMGTVRARRRT